MYFGLQVEAEPMDVKHVFGPQCVAYLRTMYGV